jgi:hypothetical protein
VVVTFFYFGVFAPEIARLGLTHWWFFALWTVLFAVGGFALVRTPHNLANLTLILSVGATVLIVAPVAKTAVYQAHNRPLAMSDPRLWPTQLQRPVLSSNTKRPDIYFIVPDDYARADVLKKYFKYDDSAFVKELTKRGFVISRQARSPYSDSEMNIAAALNMDYLSGLPTILGKRSQDVRPLRRLIADNRAARLLRSIGYRYMHLDTDEVTFPVRNPQISRFAPPDSFPNLWLQQSVLRLFGGPIGFNDKAGDSRFRTSIRSTLSRLEALPDEPGPKFVVFHTLLPHDPYIFGAEGQNVTLSDRSDEALGSRLGMRYYLAQLKYVSRKLLEITDAIRARSKTPPVIVIQSDEGFQASPDTFGQKAMEQVRVKGLIALSLPGIRAGGAPQPPNAVNTLRFVFDKYFGTRYGMLRSASYPELDLPYQFQEMRVR